MISLEQWVKKFWFIYKGYPLPVNETLRSPEVPELADYGVGRQGGGGGELTNKQILLTNTTDYYISATYTHME